MGYCNLRNISGNTAALRIAVFCKIFPKIQFAIFTHIQLINRFYSHFTFNRFYSPVIETIYKACRKEILNISTLITPCFTNCYLSAEYSNYKSIFELSEFYSEVKIPHIILFLYPF